MIFQKKALFKSISQLLVFFLLATFVSSCASQKPIINDLEEKDANEIIVFLSRKGIPAFKQKQESGGGGGQKMILYQIMVDSQDAVEAMAILNMHGLPRRKSQTLLGLFSQGGLVPSEMEEKIKYQAGLAEQIAATIRKIDGVLDADIQLSAPEENILNPEAEKADKTASVYVKHQGVLDDPNSHLRTKIRRLVSSSIDGLKYEDVTVIADRARFIGDPDLAAFDDQDEAAKEYVSIWGVIVAKESASRFRTVFFSFSVIILTLGLAIVWMLWKILPILSRPGGFGQFFALAPFNISELFGLDKKEDHSKGKKNKKKEEDDEEDEESDDDDEDDDDED